MGKKSVEGREQIVFISLDDMVPKDHLLRKIETAFNFDFIYDLVQELYSLVGKESIDPVVLFKICFIQYLYGIRSMRRTIEEIETNMAYRWFLGYGINEKIPHFSTFGKNYTRRFEGTKIFESIFNKIIFQAIELGFVDPTTVFIDGTHVKANANKNKRVKILVKENTRYFKSELEKEINEERKVHGQKPLKKKQANEVKQVNKSPIDPDSGLFWKNEREKMFCYSVNAACDKNGFILGSHVSAGNIHDSKNFQPILNQLINRFPDTITNVCADAGYIAPHIVKLLHDYNIRPILPYKRPMTKDGFFKKYEYVYDEYYDVYICPNEKILEYSRTSREGKKIYKSNPKDCSQCPYLSKCTHSSNHQKIIERHLWQEYLEEADHLRHTEKNREIYRLRSQTIERRFGDGKEKHGMRDTKYRGLQKNIDHTMLKFACMNLKKMANWMAA